MHNGRADSTRPPRSSRLLRLAGVAQLHRAPDRRLGRFLLSRLRTQRAILSAELYWFGSQLGAPKVYDAGTSFNASPVVRDSGTLQFDDDHLCGSDEGGRQIHFVAGPDGYSVTLDEA